MVAGLGIVVMAYSGGLSSLQAFRSDHSCVARALKRTPLFLETIPSLAVIMGETG